MLAVGCDFWIILQTHFYLPVSYASSYATCVQKYHHNNGNAETPASTWTSWSADISTDQSQSSPCHKLPSHRSQSPQRSGLLVPGAHPGCYDAEMTSHELHDVSPVSNVPSATYECRLSSPTTPVSAAITSANVSLL